MSTDSSRMPKFDVEWLDSLGYSPLDGPQKHQVLRAAYNAFELKVGSVLSGSLPDGLIDQFETITNHPQREVADALSFKFLQDNLPAYRDIVRVTFQQLTEELRQIRADFDELQKSRGRPSGAEDRSGATSESPNPGISDRSHMESTDEAPSGFDPSGRQEQGEPDL